MSVFLIAIFTVVLPALAARSFKIARTTGETLGFLLGNLQILATVASLICAPSQYRSIELMFVILGLMLAFFTYQQPL